MLMLFLGMMNAVCGDENNSGENGYQSNEESVASIIHLVTSCDGYFRQSVSNFYFVSFFHT